MGGWFINAFLIGATPVLFWAWSRTFCGAHAYISNWNHPKFSLYFSGSLIFWILQRKHQAGL